jgi:hypothetical protein
MALEETVKVTLEDVFDTTSIEGADEDSGKRRRGKRK